MSPTTSPTPTELTRQARSAPSKRERIAVLRRMSRAERLGAYRAGQFNLDTCCQWASLYDHEVPLLNGEYEFIARTMAEYCE